MTFGWGGKISQEMRGVTEGLSEKKEMQLAVGEIFRKRVPQGTATWPVSVRPEGARGGGGGG